jgi:hypothetical protein
LGCNYRSSPLVSSVVSGRDQLVEFLLLMKTPGIELSQEKINQVKNYTRFEWGRWENYTRFEWGRWENYTRYEWGRIEKLH